MHSLSNNIASLSSILVLEALYKAISYRHPLIGGIRIEHWLFVAYKPIQRNKRCRSMMQLVGL